MNERRSILVVDDDKAILKSLSAILESEGYNVDTVETGREAIEKSEAGSYNLVLLDIKLPDVEGTELLTKMRKEKPQMMKVMITGFPSLENAVHSLNFGADAFLMKPIDPDKLLKVVEEKLKEQEEAERMSREKVTEWAKTRMDVRKKCVRSLAEELQSMYEKAKARKSGRLFLCIEPPTQDRPVTF